MISNKKLHHTSSTAQLWNITLDNVILDRSNGTENTVLT